MSENYNVKIKNYHLNLKQTALIKNKMEFLLRQCPTNSLISLHCDFSDDFFEGHLAVISLRKKFHAATKEKTLELFIKTLYKKVQKQVYRWKKVRTYEEITGVINLDNYRSTTDTDKKATTSAKEKIAV